MKRKVTALFVTVMVSINAITSYASKSENTDSTMSVEDVKNNKEIMDEINDYLSSKLSASVALCSFDDELTELEKSAAVRSECFQKMENMLDVEFSDVEIDSSVEEIIDKCGNELTLKVYEWTEISYLASPDSDVTDVMGYGTQHKMTFENENGAYKLIEDSFDERFITGACSTDVLATTATEKEEIDCTIELMGTREQGIYAARSSYNVQDAIVYANIYCGKAAASRNYSSSGGVSTGTMHPSLYNSAYSYYNNADCANFVSQCLEAGGLPTDSTWKTYTTAWVNAKGLANYLINKGYVSYTANSNNIFPGNPVYWINTSGSGASGHQMICTGYNSSGVPVLNAQNGDMFRVPFSAFSNYNLKTIQIVSKDLHSHVAEGGYKYDASHHYYICKYCRKSYNGGAHNVVTYGNNQYCSICKYKGPFAAYYSLKERCDDRVYVLE